MRDENFDGIDDYNAQQLNDKIDNNFINDDFFADLDRDEVLQKLTEESEGVFEDGSLDDDIATFNLGYQAGTLDERERIIKLITGENK
jgi:hypothetical protein